MVSLKDPTASESDLRSEIIGEVEKLLVPSDVCVSEVEVGT